MKNTIKGHRHGGTKPASVQSQSSRAVRKKSAPNKSVGVIFFSEDDGSISPGIDLTAAEFAAIQKDAATRGESLDDWLKRTFERITAPPGQSVPAADIEALPPYMGIMDELSAAKAQAHALHHLLFDVLFAAEKAGSYGDELHFGMAELISKTDGRMEAALEIVEKRINGKMQVAA